jgi:hypothetical protein
VVKAVIVKKIIAALLFLTTFSSFAQWTPWGLGLIQKPNLASAQPYLGITNLYAGTNVTFSRFNGGFKINATGGGGGSGTVTSVSSGNASPLFTVNVATPTTTPIITFTLLYTPLKSNAVDIVSALGNVAVNEAAHATNADIATTVSGGAYQQCYQQQHFSIFGFAYLDF